MGEVVFVGWSITMFLLLLLFLLAHLGGHEQDMLLGFFQASVDGKSPLCSLNQQHAFTFITTVIQTLSNCFVLINVFNLHHQPHKEGTILIKFCREENEGTVIDIQIISHRLVLLPVSISFHCILSPQWPFLFMRILDNLFP